ncbi:MAG: hypothetical protein IIW47_01030, partial [Bacteroidales bacterium]|nr:hypothetical protein [Bacteroidales bacterium]
MNVKAGLSKIFILVLGLLHFSFFGYAQKRESADSLVRLVEAVSAHLMEENGVSYRKVIGPATFLHNNTYLKCDTALWNVNTNIIDAVGNVEILQENTRLTSDRIEYVVAEDLAKFRGSLVELMDRDGNVLNTNYLNYNTRDSIATFFNGAAMRGKDGNIIESDNGVYNSAEKRFSFENIVQIYTDSVFIVSDKVDYLTQTDEVVFNTNTVAWKDENMLCANSGNFNRPLNRFTFDKDGYILTKEQELWADLLIYYRNSGAADLYDNAQILDTVKKAICLADRIAYRPNDRTIELTSNPAIGLYTIEKELTDTLFLAGDTIKYYTRRMYEIDSASVALSAERVKLSQVDPIAIHDEERRAARAKKSDVQKPGDVKTAIGKPDNAAKPDLKKPDMPGLSAANGGNPVAEGGIPLPVAPSDTLKSATDSTALAGNDLPVAVKDTVEIKFVDIFHNVRFHRSDIQGLCDSLVYSGLDSMSRFYGRPVMWQEKVNQFSADSIQGVIKNGALSKVDLLSNAFIAAQQDSVYYNQIKGAEMAAYFRDNELYRFDALGGVSAIFYMEEKGVISLMDQEECKMLTAR